MILAITFNMCTLRKFDFSKVEECKLFLKNVYLYKLDKNKTYHINSCIFYGKKHVKTSCGEKCNSFTQSKITCGYRRTFNSCMYEDNSISHEETIMCGTHYREFCKNKNWHNKLSSCINTLCDRNNLLFTDRDKIYRFLFFGDPLVDTTKKLKTPSINPLKRSLENPTNKLIVKIKKNNDSIDVNDMKTICQPNTNLQVYQSNDSFSENSISEVSNDSPLDNSVSHEQSDQHCITPYYDDYIPSETIQYPLLGDLFKLSNYPISIDQKHDGDITTISINITIDRSKK